MFGWLKMWMARTKKAPDPLLDTALGFLKDMRGVSCKGRCACGAVFPLHIHALAETHGNGASLKSITPELACLFCEERRVVPHVHRY